MALQGILAVNQVKSVKIPFPNTDEAYYCCIYANYHSYYAWPLKKSILHPMT